MTFIEIYKQIPQKRRELLYISDLSEIYNTYLNKGKDFNKQSILKTLNSIKNPIDVLSDETKILYIKISEDLKIITARFRGFLDWVKQEPEEFNKWKITYKSELIQIQNELENHNVPYLGIRFDDNDMSQINKVTEHIELDEIYLPEDDEDEEYIEKWEDIVEAEIIEPNRKLDDFEWQPQTLFSNFKINDSKPKEEVPVNDYQISPHLIYRNLPPENRYMYLKWLIDIEQPINRNYVYMYLECLERRGIYSDVINVIDELVLIMKFHPEKTIINRCSVALNNICFYRDKLENLYRIYNETVLIEMSNPLLVYFIQEKIELKAKEILSLFKALKFKLTIVKGFDSQFLKSIEVILNKKYLKKEMPFGSIYNLENVPTVKSNFINNFLLNIEIDYVRIPEVWYISDFNEKLNDIYLESYEFFKKNKKK